VVVVAVAASAVVGLWPDMHVVDLYAVEDDAIVLQAIVQLFLLVPKFLNPS